MFQFMFMVQLLVKFRFFIQELWERKFLQILYECWRQAYHALLAQLFIKRLSWKHFFSLTFFLMMFNISNLAFPCNLNLLIKIVHFCSPKVHGYFFFLHIKETNYLQHRMVYIYTIIISRLIYAKIHAEILNIWWLMVCVY